MLELPNLPPDSLVAVDTETSGLFVDDGARVSIVSIAWYEGGGTPGNPSFAYPGWDGAAEQVGAGDIIPRSAVFAFDQGWVTPLGEKRDIPPALAKTKADRKRQNQRQQVSLFEETIDAAPNLDPDYYPILLEWLSTHSLVFHNAKFDLHILARGLRGMEERWSLPDLAACTAWDTQVVNPVLWPEFQTSLKPTSQRLFGEEEADLQKQLQKWLKKNGYRFDLAPWPLVAPYAAKDAELTLRLYDVQQLALDIGERMVTPAEMRVVAEREVDLAICLYRMESRGIGLDAAGMLDEAEKISGMAMRAEQDLRIKITENVPRFKTTPPGQIPAVTEHLMRSCWFDSSADGGLGLFPVKMTDGGIASVAQDAVRELADRGEPLAKEYEKLNSLQTAHGMWYNTWSRQVGPPEPGWHEELIDPQNEHDRLDPRWPRLRTNYRQSRTHQEKGGTVSGRLAVERIQLQAIPQDYQIPEGVTPVRRFFQPDPGYVLWEVDLSQAEYRVAAGVSKCQAMIDRFLAGDDAHSATCRLIFKIDEDHPDWDARRAVAKRLNFGMLYGAGAETTRAQIKIYTGMVVSQQEMQDWLDDYRRAFPEMKRMAKRVEKMAQRHRSIVLAGGRERWFSWGEQEHKAFNQLVQGGVAEMMKEAMIEFEANRPGIMLLQIHDSIIGESRRDQAEDDIQFAKEILVGTFEREFHAPFKCDSKIWKSYEAVA